MSRLLTRLALAACAPLIAAAAMAAAPKGAEPVAAAFEERGMSAEQSACYGREIATALDGDTGEAVQIVSTAQNAQEIEDGVKNSGLDMVKAFLAANTTCGS